MESYNYQCHELRGSELVPLKDHDDRVKSIVLLPSKFSA
jgi:hypothetical protein